LGDFWRCKPFHQLLNELRVAEQSVHAGTREG
jgi:hypothetical protein